MPWTSSFIFAPNQRITYLKPSTGVLHTYEIEAVVNDRENNKQIFLMCYELEGKQ